jgi:FkbM family methyltransferase
MLAIGRAIGHARFVPFGIRDRALRFLFPPQSRLDRPFVVPLGSARYAGNLDNYIDWSIFFYGQYERYLLSFIAQVLPRLGPNPVFWDIGANNGQHALFAASLGAQVEAFEPFEPVRSKLLHSLTLNPAFDIRVHPFGLGNVAGDFVFTVPDNENMATGHFAVAAPNESPPQNAPSLPIRRGDDVEARSPALIKIDVEGFEGDVLRGLACTIAKARPIIVCEFSPRSKERDGDLRQLLPSGYSASVVGGVEWPLISAYTGAGNGEMVLFLPEEKTGVVAGIRTSRLSPC